MYTKMIDTTKFDDEFFTEYIKPICMQRNITCFGVVVKTPGKTLLHVPIRILHVPNIKQAMLEIPRLIRPRVKGDPREGVSSYGGKHVIERYRTYKYGKGTYISNGEFMIAMVLLGYEPKNWDLNINQLFVATYINRDLVEFDFEEFYTNFVSKMEYWCEPIYPQTFLPSIDFEIPNLPGWDRDHIKQKVIKRFYKDARINHCKRVHKGVLRGVEYTGKFLEGYGTIWNDQPAPKCFERV